MQSEKYSCAIVYEERRTLHEGTSVLRCLCGEAWTTTESYWIASSTWSLHHRSTHVALFSATLVEHFFSCSRTIWELWKASPALWTHLWSSLVAFYQTRALEDFDVLAWVSCQISSSLIQAVTIHACFCEEVIVCRALYACMCRRSQYSDDKRYSVLQD
jgi:hypothetical protein